MEVAYTNNFYEQYKGNVYSQNGEDGVLEELLKRLGIQNGYACEFGAWDGKHLSNTFNLVTKGWCAVYIESDEPRFRDLLETCKEYPKIVPIMALVDNKKSPTCLDALLKPTDIPHDFDLLSIDIDSYDYQVWDTLKNYQPKVVVVEINSGIFPNVLDHIHGVNGCIGTGFLPMLKLARSKGYTFAFHTGNMVFVRSDLFPATGITYTNPQENFHLKFLQWAGLV